ncbi:MAG: histone deacetylase [Anaerolineae bacterium]|nr:histone deacetylase [Anaerolineae bacterium]
MNKIGYVYETIFCQHDLPEHPENASRLGAILDYLTSNDIISQLTRVAARPATPNELQRCHHPLYIEMVEDTCRYGGGMLDGDTYTNSFSFDAAIQAAGGVIELTKAVVKGELDNGFALVRPPGHHAVPSSAMGFCLFGTAAIAARSARRDLKLERVAVIDFDVHHGNGTQAILNEDPHIFFASSHQYPFYPGTGALREIGRGPGEGAILNVPLSVMTGDDGIRRLYDEAVFAALRRFEPELILVSAGYDAHWQDPLANIGLTLKGYQWLSEGLIALANEICEGRIVFILEGGYNLEVLAPGVGNTFRALLGINNYDDPIGKCPWQEPEVDSLLSEIKRVHRL